MGKFVFKLTLCALVFVVTSWAWTFIGSLVFTRDYLFSRTDSPYMSKLGLEYGTVNDSKRMGQLHYGQYYLIRPWYLFWRVPSLDDAFFAGYCNSLVRDEKRMTWLSEYELQFYCHIRSCESIVKILPTVGDVNINYIVEQDNREERNCLAEAL